MVQEKENKMTKDICEICDLTELAREIVKNSKEEHPLDFTLKFCREKRLLPVEVEILMTGVYFFSLSRNSSSKDSD